MTPPARFVRQCLAVVRRDLALHRTYGASALLGIVAAVLGLVAYHYIGRLVGAAESARLPGGGYFAFVWSGLSVQVVVAASLGALGGALAREAAEGTLEPGLAAGASPAALVVGGAGAPALLALLQVAIYVVAGTALFGLDLGAARPGPTLAALLATVAACAPVGFVAAACWLWLRRAGFVTTAALFAFGVVGGIYFPVELLPGPIAAAAAWVPFTLGLEAVRAAVLEGAGWRETSLALLRLTVVAGLTLPPSLWLLRAATDRALRRGTLALV